MTLEHIKKVFKPKNILGIFFTLIPILEFWAEGYKLAYAKILSQGSFELPNWKDFKTLFKIGFFARVVQLCFLSVPFLLILWLYTKSKFVAAQMQNLAFVNSQTFLLHLYSIRQVALFLVFVLAIVCFFMPAFVINYARTQNLKQAFSKNIFRKIFTKHHILGWLLSSAVSIACLILLLLLFMQVTSFFANKIETYSPFLTLVVILISGVILWYPSFLYWAILGNAWYKIEKDLEEKRSLESLGVSQEIY
ncbi:MAG: DUF4013 domain-containing protein [Candidatus Nanoarchaeia archaeon]